MRAAAPHQFGGRTILQKHSSNMEDLAASCQHITGLQTCTALSADKHCMSVHLANIPLPPIVYRDTTHQSCNSSLSMSADHLCTSFHQRTGKPGSLSNRHSRKPQQRHLQRWDFPSRPVRTSPRQCHGCKLDSSWSGFGSSQQCKPCRTLCCRCHRHPHGLSRMLTVCLTDSSK